MLFLIIITCVSFLISEFTEVNPLYRSSPTEFTDVVRICIFRSSVLLLLLYLWLHLLEPLSYYLSLSYNCRHIPFVHMSFCVCMSSLWEYFPLYTFYCTPSIIYILLCTSYCLLLYGRLLYHPSYYFIITLGNHWLSRIRESLQSTDSLPLLI